MSIEPQLLSRLRPDGSAVLSSSLQLNGAEVDIAQKLREQAACHPGRPLLTEPDGAGGRRSLSYAQALAEARALHGRLLRRGLRRGDRIGSLLPAGIDALRLRLACLLGGFVHTSLPPHPFRVSVADDEAARLLRVVRPALLVAPAGHALMSLGEAVALHALPAAPPAEDHDGAPDDWTAIFFTAGSTGASKGVPITRAMIASCQAGCVAAWPFLAERPPVLIDWMPWNHVFGGLDNIFKMIWNGGTLHLAPPPSAAGMDAMLHLMTDEQPTLFIGVPLGLKLLMEAHEAGPAHVARACAALTHIFFAGAAMEPSLWLRLQDFRADMQARHGQWITILSGYGATEAASTMCLAPGDIAGPGALGWPLPGHEVALVETDGCLEIRFRGPNLAPCYLGEGGIVPLPLDEEGFYRTGDAGLLTEDATGRKMLRFDGRISEDFKLASGIKVRSGLLRGQLLRKLGPLAQDLVLGGAGSDGLVALIFAAPATCEETLAKTLHDWNRENPGSSTAIRRFALARFTPSVEAGEVSAKGQLVQSRILRNHAGLFVDLAEGRMGCAVG